MPPEEIRSYLRAVPFVPFRLHLTDGRTFDIHNRDCLLLAQRTAAVGVFDADQGKFPDHLETISLLHIVSIEPLPTLAAPQE
jgi:hypothetical protein